MPDNWIGRILLTQDDAVRDDLGKVINEYLPCDGSVVDEDKYPVLASKLPAVEYTQFTDLGDLAGGTHNLQSVAVDATGKYVYVLRAESGLLLRSNDGVTFTETTHTLGNKVACASDNSNVYVLDTPTAYVYKSSDGGTSFTQVSAIGMPRIEDITCTYNGSRVYVIEYDYSKLYVSSDYGEGMVTLIEKLSFKPYRITTSATGAIVYILDVSGIVHRSIDSGHSFSEYSEALGSPRDICCNSSGDTIIVQTSTNMYISEEGTGVFIAINHDISTQPISVALSDTGALYATTTNMYTSPADAAHFKPNMPAPTGSPNPYKIIADKS